MMLHLCYYNFIIISVLEHLYTLIDSVFKEDVLLNKLLLTMPFEEVNHNE